MAQKVSKWCEALIQIMKLRIHEVYPTLKSSIRLDLKMGKKRPKMTLFYNKHIIRWARNLKNIIIFLMATHPSHPQSLKKQNPNFSFFSQNCLTLDRLCKIKPQTAKMASQTSINEFDMLKTIETIDFQQKIIGLDFCTTEFQNHSSVVS